MSPLIKQLQLDLVALGYDPGTVDGKWGANTKGACYDARDDHPSLPAVTSPISDAFCKEVAALAFGVRVPAPVPLPPNYIDLTRFASQGWKKKDRPWSAITGITLHQTGCPMSEQPSRWYGLKAHYGVTYSGKTYRVRKETDFGWHAQAQSHTHVGIEIAGFFCGVEGDLSTRPYGPEEWAVQSVTEEQVTATLALVDYLCALAQYHGGKIETIDAHRTATNSRRPDPGSKVWQRIALPSLAKHKLSTGKVTGSGLPIPDAWSGEARGIKY